MADWDDDEADESALTLKLDLPATATKVASSSVVPAASVEDDAWDVVSKPTSTIVTTATTTSNGKYDDKEPDIIILVDLTVLSNGTIHNKFDKHSVNDPDAKKELCNLINTQYSIYENDSKLISEGTVRHCSERVWKDAIEQLRDEKKGHYWFPFFPPKSKAIMSSK